MSTVSGAAGIMEIVELTGRSLDASLLSATSRKPEIKFNLSAEAWNRVTACREFLEEEIGKGAVVYGVNTSMGGFVKWLVPLENAEKLQANLIAAVATNVGTFFEDEVVRAAMIARVNSLARGHSAIRPKTLRLLLEMINRGVIPCVPQQGSLGASGDLGPLACIAQVLSGRWKARVNGHVLPGEDALAAVGLQSTRLAFKEGLALINGTSFMTALAALMVHDAQILIASYELISALSCEGLGGRSGPFAPEIHEAKGHPGQIQVARALRLAMTGSSLSPDDEVASSHLSAQIGTEIEEGEVPIEDAYSIRCTPQILGPVVETVAFARTIIDRELNSSNDNPLVFSDTREIRHNGNFHGQYTAMASDMVTMSMTTLTNLSDRRIDRFMDPGNSNGLPAFLCKENPGLRLGLMGGQFMATSMTAENRSLTTPVSCQTLPSTGDFQDHVSMGLVAARRLRDVLRNSRYVVAFEVLCACQAVDIRGTQGLATGTRHLYRIVRERVPYLSEDAQLTDYIEALAGLIATGELAGQPAPELAGV